MTRARLLSGAIVMPAALLAAACSASGHPASSTAGTRPSSAAVTPSAAPSAPASTVPATAAAIGSAAPAAPAAPAASPVVTTSACAALAAHTFVRITAVQAGADGSLTVTGSPAALVCGGLDDLHYDVSGSIVTGHVVPSAAITVIPLPTLPGKPFESLRTRQLAGYLASDEDTRIFLVTGPLSRITGLQEEYHP